MGSGPVFFDCPAYLDMTGSARCGLPAEVEDEYIMQSTDGPLRAVRIRCPHGHYFNGLASLLRHQPGPDTWTADGDSAGYGAGDMRSALARIRSLASP
jgi:hypothetical protein